MPREKRFLRFCGTIAEYEVTDETHWAQMVGENLVRCDDDALKTGRGLWKVFESSRGGETSWVGIWNRGLGSCHSDPFHDLWVANRSVDTYYDERDVS